MNTDVQKRLYLPEPTLCRSSLRQPELELLERWCSLGLSRSLLPPLLTTGDPTCPQVLSRLQEESADSDVLSHVSLSEVWSLLSSTSPLLLLSSFPLHLFPISVFFRNFSFCAFLSDLAALKCARGENLIPWGRRHMRSYQAGGHISMDASRRWPGHHTRTIPTVCVLIQQRPVKKAVSANRHIETNGSQVLLVLYITLQLQTQWGKRTSSTLPISTVEVR